MTSRLAVFVNRCSWDKLLWFPLSDRVRIWRMVYGRGARQESTTKYNSKQREALTNLEMLDIFSLASGADPSFPSFDVRRVFRDSLAPSASREDAEARSHD